MLNPVKSNKTNFRVAGWTLTTILLVSLLVAFIPPLQASAAAESTVVLVLVDGLTWDEVESVPGLRETFEGGAVANLSTAQGSTPDDPRFGYTFLGAGARVDTAVLPEDLPQGRENLADSFEGPASTVRPGALGEALSQAGIQTAAVGENAGLITMDESGKTGRTYDTGNPVAGLGNALEDGADLVVVEATSPEQAGQLAKAAREAGTMVAVASPNDPIGPEDLTPFALDGTDGVLYSPTTRTEALISNADVAPTLLSELGVEPPDGMQGRPTIVRPGTWEGAERLGDRLAFVAEKRFEVWVMVGIAAALALLTTGYFKGRAGLSAAILGVASLPAGALLAAAVPITIAPVVAILTLLFAAALTGISLFFSGRFTFTGALAGVCLLTAALITADASAGGALMKLSTLGYNPAYGARFYGIGNEYSAVLAGSLTMGFGALASRIRLPSAVVPMLGAVVVVVLGFPTMGADVGGSLALGLGVGASAAWIQGRKLWDVALWAGGGFFAAAMLFVLSGVFFPGVSHGSRAASGSDGGLVDIAVRKLILSAEHLLNPLQVLLLVAGLVLVYVGWRRARSATLAAGMLGATTTALASGILNDSGILATLFALACPATAALGVLLVKDNRELR